VSRLLPSEEFMFRLRRVLTILLDHFYKMIFFPRGGTLVVESQYYCGLDVYEKDWVRRGGPALIL